MGILPIVPLPKHQIIIFTHEAIRKKVRGQLGEMEKVTPTDPMPMGVSIEEKINERAICSTHGFIMQARCQKKAPISHLLSRWGQ
jgi:hypothetical protein